MAFKKKNVENRKNLLIISSFKEGEVILNNISKIRGDSRTYKSKTKINVFESTDEIQRILAKLKCSLFLVLNKNKKDELILSMGRAFNNEVIDMVEFKIVEHKRDFGCVAPELGVKYFIVAQNLENERMQNLFIDIFNMKTNEACLEGIKYALVLSKLDDKYVFKYVRILENLGVEDCGFCFDMELSNSYFCNDEDFNKSLCLEKIKKVKNVSSNKFKDKIGTIHVEKQDLKDIRLKKRKNK